MPIKITGKIADADGFPIQHIAEISEIPINSTPGLFPTVSANVWSDENTGDFTFFALYPSSLIKVSATGYKTRTFPATAVPSVIEMEIEDMLVINGKTKKDNTLLLVAGALLAAGLLYYMSKSEPVKKAATVAKARTAKAVRTVRAKALPKPKPAVKVTL